MKYTFLLLILICIAGCQRKQLCDLSAVIKTGDIDSTNVYINTDMNIYWQLPSDMEWYISKGYPASELTIKDLIERKRDIPLWGISKKISDGTSHVNLSVSIVYSETQNADTDLKELINQLATEIEGDKFSDISIAQDKIEMEGEKANVVYITKKEYTRGMILRNYGCYNLLISFGYASNTGKNELENLLKTINFHYTQQPKI